MRLRECLNCGKFFIVTPRKLRQNTTVCGILCRNKYYRNIGKKHWNYKTGIAFYRKIKVKEKCEICSSKKNLLVHHLNNNRYNNDNKNLQVVCKKCHQEIHCTRDMLTGCYIKISN